MFAGSVSDISQDDHSNKQSAWLVDLWSFREVCFREVCWWRLNWVNLGIFGNLCGRSLGWVGLGWVDNLVPACCAAVMVESFAFFYMEALFLVWDKPRRFWMSPNPTSGNKFMLKVERNWWPMAQQVRCSENVAQLFLHSLGLFGAPLLLHTCNRHDHDHDHHDQHDHSAISSLGLDQAGFRSGGFLKENQFFF